VRQPRLFLLFEAFSNKHVVTSSSAVTTDSFPARRHFSYLLIDKITQH
jgi:hypothetical protein